MEREKYIKREEMLQLSVSTKNYIILRDYIFHHADRELYQKLLREYSQEIPVFELVQILLMGRVMLGWEYQSVVELIFEERKYV